MNKKFPKTDRILALIFYVLSVFVIILGIGIYFPSITGHLNSSDRLVNSLVFFDYIGLAGTLLVSVGFFFIARGLDKK